MCSTLYRRVRALAPAVQSTLNGLRAESRGLDLLQQTQVDELLPLKNKLDELKKRVNIYWRGRLVQYSYNNMYDVL